MARTKISEFSSTPASNTDIDSIFIGEGMAPSNVNDAIRELMSQLKDFQTGAQGDSFNGPIGSSTAVTGAFTTVTTTSTINGLTVGKGGGSVSNNTAVGYQALLVNTTGSYNTAAGANTLLSNTSGSGNTAFGIASLAANTTGGENVALGGSSATSPALRLNTTGSYNIGVGAGALSSNTTANRNAAVGYQSLYTNTTGAENSALGHSSLYYNTTGSYNVGVGGGALQSNTTASNNVAIGYQALYANTTGSPNVAIGRWSMLSNTTGTDNASYGDSSLSSNTTGSSNTALGRLSLYSNTTSSNNTAVGYQSGFSNSTGAGNTFLGYTAGYSTTGGYNTFVGNSPNYGAGFLITTGTKNTIIGGYNGNQGGLDIRTANNYIVLSDGDGNPRGIFTNSGQLLVGSTSTVASGNEIAGFKGTVGISARSTGGASSFAGSFWNDSTSGDNIFLRFYTETAGTERGAISYNRGTGLVVYGTTSDYRAKDIIGPVTGSGALIDSTPVYIGKMKGATQERPMFIAHETPAYAHIGVKDAVDADGNPIYQQMDASALIPVMWAEIQSLRKRLANAGIA